EALRTLGVWGPYRGPQVDRRGRNSVAECQLPKLDVAGSNPVGRSKNSGGYGVTCSPLVVSGHQMVTHEAVDSRRKRDDDTDGERGIRRVVQQVFGSAEGSQACRPIFHV